MAFILNTSRTLIRSSSRGSYMQTVNFFGDLTTNMNLASGRTLKFIVALFPADCTLRVGTTPGGNELVDDTVILANETFPIEIGFVDRAGVAPTTIYFTATVANGVIDLYRF